MGTFENIQMSDGVAIEVYHAKPSDIRRGGIVLFQEIFGLTEHIQEQCDLFASEGYEVLAPSLFDRSAPGVRLSYDKAGWEKAIELLRDHSFDAGLLDATSCVDELRRTGAVFVLGYCYGGSLAWASASRLSGLSGAVCYYGGKLPALATEKPLCPVLVHLGRDDREIPMRQTRDLLEMHPNVEVLTYPAGHGFNSDRRSDFDAQCSTLAFRETLLFLKNHLAIDREK